MNSKILKSKALSLCLVIATMTTYSMVALASPNKVVGEISVSGKAAVQVNGEATQSGRSIFSSSTINTPDNTDAVVNFGDLGKVKIDSKSMANLSFDSENLTSTLVNGEVGVMSSTADDVNTLLNIADIGQLQLSPDTSIILAYDGKQITGQLLAGEVVVLNTTKTINITLNGEVSKLNTGDRAKVQVDDDCDNDGIKNDVDDDDGCDEGGGAAWLPWALLFGGAIALIVSGFVMERNNADLGGGGVIVSPVQ